LTGSIARMTEEFRKARTELAFLDCNLWIGRPRQPEFIQRFDIDVLRAEMARYDIRGGVVSHFAGIYYSPVWANEEVLRAGDGDLWAGITLVPEMFTPEQAGRAYLSQAISQGARLARVFPATHHFSLRAWCSGALVQALADSRMPLVVWLTETSWEEIRHLCDSYPQLTVIVESGTQKILYHDRVYYPLLDKYPNLRLELHNLVNYLGVEDIVRRHGAERLLFGTYMLVWDPNASIMQVTHARISAADKALIARENLAELLAGVRQL